MPYGNFHLRESTVQSILTNPKYGPKSELGANMYTYLKFGLPRVLPPRPHSGSGGGPTRDQVSRLKVLLKTSAITYFFLGLQWVRLHR